MDEGRCTAKQASEGLRQEYFRGVRQLNDNDVFCNRGGQMKGTVADQHKWVLAAGESKNTDSVLLASSRSADIRVVERVECSLGEPLRAGLAERTGYISHQTDSRSSLSRFFQGDTTAIKISYQISCQS